jgi:creatinine amidohydrolase
MLTTDSFYWSRMTSKAFAAYPVDRAIAVLPIGAIEQHGPHLPVSVDADIVDGLVRAAIERLASMKLRVLVLPTQAVGKSDEHLRFPGTLTLSAETLIRTWAEIGACVARSGVHKILLLNSHGGQMAPLDIVARALRIEHRMLAVQCNWFQLGLPEKLFSAHEQLVGIHAGDMETSMMLALHPERVVMSDARNFASASEEHHQTFRHIGRSPGARLGWQMQDLNPEGACGNAAAATAEKGHAVIDFVAQRIVDVLNDMDQYDMTRLDGPTAW